MPHAGHRERLRKKFDEGTLEPHELLEMLLFYSLPRVNTNEIAHMLIDTCGSFEAVFESDAQRLKKVKGVGDNSVALIRLTGELMRRRSFELCHTEELLSSEVELYKYLSALFLGEYEEKVYMLMFGKNKKFFGHVRIGEGLFDQSSIMVKKAVLEANRNGAGYVIIAHNHPNGITYPSDSDIFESKKMNLIFKNAGIKVLEHCIVADGRCVTFYDKTV